MFPFTALNQLLTTVAHLTNISRNSSDDEFAAILDQLEQAVDKLVIVLRDEFGEDPDIMQLMLEIKAAIFAHRRANVESATES